MGRLWDRAKRIAVILAVGGCVGFVLLLLAYMLPVERMLDHARASIEIFEDLGLQPQIIKGYETTTIDTYTDAWMLRMAFYDGDESALEKCLCNYYYGYDNGTTTNVIESMIAYLKGAEGYIRIVYGRYWHGYTIILKPLLLFFDYADILGILKFVQLALTALCIVLLERKKMARCIPGLVAMLACIDFHTVGISMQYSWVFLIAMLSAAFLLLKKEEKYYDPSIDAVFLVTGMCTSYFDFLTYPLFTLGVPLTVMLAQREMAERKGRMFVSALINSVYWLIGYAGMWMIKWVLCTVLTDNNMMEDAIHTILYRAGSDVFGETVGVLDVFRENIRILLRYPYALAGVCAVAVLLLWGGKERWRFIRVSPDVLFSYLFVACLPFVWYAAVKEHSYVHYVVTYRDLGISIFAGTCFIAGLKKRREAPDEQAVRPSSGMG